MPSVQAQSVLTDADRNEINELFSASLQAIAIDKLHDLSARIFSESMTALNKLSANKNPAEVKTQIKYIKSRHNEYTTLIHDHIYQSCVDQKAVEAWLRVANDCQEKCNDMLGHIIRNALAKVMAEKKVALPTLSDTILYKKLYGQYFPTFSNTDDYKEHLLSTKKNAIAPALPYYLNHLEEMIKREEDFTRIREMRQLLTDDEWKLVTTNISGKSESGIYEHIDSVLLNLGKSQHVGTLSETFKEFVIDDHESLRRKFEKADSYFAEKNKVEPDPFITKYTSSINPKLVRSIPAAPVVSQPVIEKEISAVSLQPVQRTVRPAVNFEEELKQAKGERERFNGTRSKSALSDSEIKEAIRINNQIIQIYIRQRNACEERYAGGDIPANEMQLQASINVDIDQLKTDNATLRKKLFKPDENKIDRQPTALQAMEIETIAPAAVVTPTQQTQQQPEKELPRDMLFAKENRERGIDTTHGGKFVYKRPIDQAAKTDMLMAKSENTSATDKKLK